MTPNSTSAPRPALAAMRPPAPPTAPSLVDELRRLDALVAASGDDLHRRVIVLVQACIAANVRSPSRIATLLVTIGRDRGHVWRMIKSGTGGDSALFHWRAGTDGNLYLHDEDAKVT